MGYAAFGFKVCSGKRYCGTPAHSYNYWMFPPCALYVVVSCFSSLPCKVLPVRKVLTPGTACAYTVPEQTW